MPPPVPVLPPGAHKQVTCPCIGALIKNGDLVPDAADGMINKEMTRQALMRVGISKKAAIQTTRFNFESSKCPQCPKRINPFIMNTIPSGQTMPSPEGGAQVRPALRAHSPLTPSTCPPHSAPQHIPHATIQFTL